MPEEASDRAQTAEESAGKLKKELEDQGAGLQENLGKNAALTAKLDQTEQRARALESRAQDLERVSDDQRHLATQLQSAQAEATDALTKANFELKGANELAGRYKQVADAVGRRIVAQADLAKRARELATLLRTVDERAATVKLESGTTIQKLLSDAEKDLLKSLADEAAKPLNRQEKL